MDLKIGDVITLNTAKDRRAGVVQGRLKMTPRHAFGAHGVEILKHRGNLHTDGAGGG